VFWRGKDLFLWEIGSVLWGVFKWIFASFEGAFQLPIALRLLMRVLSPVGLAQLTSKKTA
jgi:hypothetical protein